jgi:hypothetical protein
MHGIPLGGAGGGGLISKGQMKSCTRVPRLWWQVGLTVLPGLIFLLASHNL